MYPTDSSLKSNTFWDLNNTYDHYMDPEDWSSPALFLLPIHPIFGLIGTVHGLIKLGYHATHQFRWIWKLLDNKDDTKWPDQSIRNHIKNCRAEGKIAQYADIKNLGYTKVDLPSLKKSLQFALHAEAMQKTWEKVKDLAKLIIPLIGACWYLDKLNSKGGSDDYYFPTSTIQLSYSETLQKLIQDLENS